MFTKYYKFLLTITAIFISFFSACKENMVIITKEYVINSNWNEADNTFTVYRMKLKDSSQSIDPHDPSESELYHGLTKDYSFLYTANVEYNGVEYSERKVYFNRANGFVWCKLNNIDLKCEREILGELQQETWYLLAGLSPSRTIYYIYLDSSDRLLVHKVSTMTNY